MYIEHNTNKNSAKLISEAGVVIMDWPDVIIVSQNGYVEVITELTATGTVFNGCVPVLRIGE